MTTTAHINTSSDVIPPDDIARMTTATVQIDPGIAPPSGATTNDDWQRYDDPRPYRIVVGVDRTVTDHVLRVSTSAVQWTDGSVDDGGVEAPQIHVFDLSESGPLNSDQARELASALLEAAADIDRWAGR
jgi:hypothetical protein